MAQKFYHSYWFDTLSIVKWRNWSQFVCVFGMETHAMQIVKLYMAHTVIMEVEKICQIYTYLDPYVMMTIFKWLDSRSRKEIEWAKIGIWSEQRNLWIKRNKWRNKDTEYNSESYDKTKGHRDIVVRNKITVIINSVHYSRCRCSIYWFPSNDRMI